MARRSDHTREELKELAINAGHKLIAEKGFSNFSARKMAQEIGYTVGTLYNIFGDYDDIILNINAKTLDQLTLFILQELHQCRKKEDQLTCIALAYLEFAKQHRLSWLALFEHILPNEKSLPEWYANKISTIFNIIERTLTDTAGNTVNSKALSRTLWASIHGICILGISGKLQVTETPVSMEDMISLLIQQFSETSLAFG